MYSFKMLENPWYCTEEIIEKNSLGIIVDGITDFDAFLNKFKIIDNEMIIHQLSKTSLFLLFKSNFQNFKLLKKDFDYSHYHVYSIFLKEKYFDKFSEYFKQDKSKIPSFKKKLYYLFFESNNYTSKYIKIQNQSDFKILTKSPLRYFYGFDTYKDLLAAYAFLVEEGQNWPIFALPAKFIEKVVNMNFFNTQDEIKENNILLYRKYQSKFPLFCPDEKLFYLSFIEKEIKNFQRIQNSEEIYSIKEIDDIQISHIYKESIRTFLGFKNLFRCLHVFDFFIHFEKEKKKIFDVELIENSFNNLNRVRYDLFYIEIQHDKLQSQLFDSSILYTLNYVDLCELNSSYFYGFDNQTDFEEALQIFSESKKIVIDDIRIVDRNEFNSLFDKKIISKIVKTQFFYIIFSLQKGEIIELKTILKPSKIIEKNVNVKNMKYFLVGFVNNDDRQKVFNSLKKFQQSNEIRCFRPENEESSKKKKKHKKKSIQNSEHIENSIEKAEKEQIDQIESDEYDFESFEQTSQITQPELNQKENQQKNEEDEKINQTQNDQIKFNSTSEKLNGSIQNSAEPKKTAEEKPPKNLGSDYFSPNQNLIYLYFIEKEKARKISQGKQAKLTLFGVKKCKDIQRYKKLNSSEENGYFTFFGFEKYEETVAGVNDIKSKWLSETTIKIYEGTNAFKQHQNEPNSLYNSEDEQLFMQAIKDKKQQNKRPNINSIKDKNFNINNIRINCYKSFDLDQISSFFYFDQISVPNNIQLEIKNVLSKSRIVKKIIKDVVLANYIESPCTVIFLDGYDPLVDMLYKTAFGHHKIGYSLIDYETYDHFHYIEINEHFIEKKCLEKLIVFLSKVDEVEKIDRSVFHHGIIVTFIFFDFSHSFIVARLIERFLRNENLLFDNIKYPLKKTIFFNEEVTLKKKEDFDLILNEIENFGIHPIKVERNKLLFTEIPYINNCIHKFSFICFKSKEEKLRALNHINSIVLKDIKDVNIVKFNPSLFYMKIDPFKYSVLPNKNTWSLLEKTVKNLVDVGDFQMKVRSIESPIELGYIGFKSKRYLSFYHQLVLVRLINLSTNPDINFFNPNDRLFYLQYQTKNGVDLVRCVKSEFIDKIKDYQPNCLKLDEHNHQMFSYIGFETEQERGFAFFQLTSIIKNPNIINVMALGIEFKDGDLKGPEELISENLITLINS